MKIEIGKTYTVSAYYKKSLVEIEMFRHEDGRGLNTEIMWRNGTFIIRIEDEDERNALQETVGEDGDIWDYDDYSNIEMDSTFDGCAEDFVFYGNHFTEEEQEALEEEYEEDDECFSRFDFLEEREFYSDGCNWQIHGGTEVELAETELPAMEE